MQLWEGIWAVDMLARISRLQPQRRQGAVWQWRRHSGSSGSGGTPAGSVPPLLLYVVAAAVLSQRHVLMSGRCESIADVFQLFTELQARKGGGGGSGLHHLSLSPPLCWCVPPRVLLYLSARKAP